MEIRKACLADMPEIGSCHYHCWQETYRGLIDDDFLDRMSEAVNRDRFAAYVDRVEMMYVVIEGEAIVGFFDVSPAREDFAPYEIQGLYLRKAFQGRGYGRKMMEKVFDLCQGKPFYLWCLATNPTTGYYTHFNGQMIAQKESPIGSHMYQEVCYLFPGKEAKV